MNPLVTAVSSVCLQPFKVTTVWLKQPLTIECMHTELTIWYIKSAHSTAQSVLAIVSFICIEILLRQKHRSFRNCPIVLQQIASTMTKWISVTATMILYVITCDAQSPWISVQLTKTLVESKPPALALSLIAYLIFKSQECSQESELGGQNLGRV